MRLVLLLLSLVASPALAEWVRNGSSSDGSTAFYYDPATIRVNGNMRLVWEVQDLKERAKEGGLSNRALWEYDCKEEQHRILSFSMYSGPMVTGNTLISDGKPGQWDYVPPRSADADMLKMVCSVK